MIGKYVVILGMDPDKDYAPDRIKEALQEDGYDVIDAKYLGELADYYDRKVDKGQNKH